MSVERLQPFGQRAGCVRRHWPVTVALAVEGVEAGQHDHRFREYFGKRPRCFQVMRVSRTRAASFTTHDNHFRSNGIAPIRHRPRKWL
jgi:hypothetical protein